MILWYKYNTVLYGVSGTIIVHRPKLSFCDTPIVKTYDAHKRKPGITGLFVLGLTFTNDENKEIVIFYTPCFADDGYFNLAGILHVVLNLPADVAGEQ